MTLGSKLRDIRQEKGLKLKDQNVVSVPYLCDIENNKTPNISLKVIKKLCDFYKVPVTYLLSCVDNSDYGEDYAFRLKVKTMENIDMKLMLGHALSQLAKYQDKFNFPCKLTDKDITDYLESKGETLP